MTDIPQPSAGQSPPLGPPPPAASGFTTRYGLVRPREGRYLAGVCAAIARATNTDPVLWRVLLAVLGFFFGIGILVYVAAWIIIPAEGDTASPVEAMLGKGRSSMSPVTVIILGVFVVVMFGFIVTDPFRAVLLGAAILIGGALLLSRNAGAATPVPAGAGPTPAAGPGPWGGSGPRGGSGPWGGGPQWTPPWNAATAAGPAAPSPAAGPADSAAGPADSAPGAGSGAPGWPAGTAGAPFDPATSPAGPAGTAGPGDGPPPYAGAPGAARRGFDGPPPYAGAPGTGGPAYGGGAAAVPPPPNDPTLAYPAPPAPPVGYGAPFAPHGPYAGGGYPPGPPLPPAPPRPKPPKPPKERSPLGAIAFSLIPVVIGLVAIADLLNLFTVKPSSYFAAVLFVIALGLLVGTWIGRARWLIFLGLAMAAAVGISSVAESQTANDTSRGREVVWQPSSLQAVRPDYRLAFGEATLDLRDVDFSTATGTTTVSVNMNAGELRIYLPPTVDVSARVDIDAGDARVFDDRTSGFGEPAIDVTDLGTDGDGGGELRLLVHVNTGDVEVTR
jgi:phage shock protein PspC (stress-responsive transcriptional regulator)